MKGWQDIPEYKKLWDEAMAEYEYLKTLEYDKNNEFDTPEHRHWIKWNPILIDFVRKYKKEHPEEFDENGKFKQ